MKSNYTWKKLNKRKLIYLTFTSIILLFFLISCALEPNWQFTFSDPPHNDDGKASLTVNISLGLQPKTLIPDIDLNPYNYDIVGSGPNSANFNILAEQTTVTVPSLDPGEWTVTANAKNMDGTVILMGKSSAILNPGNTKSLDIVVAPVEGHGTLDLAVYWEPADVYSPSVEAQITPASGSPIDLSFTINQGSAICVDNTIPTGYHTLEVRLLDNGTLVMGAVEVVRILNEQVTSGTFEFFDINQPGGDIAINITPETSDPIEVIMDGQLNEILLGESMTANASVPEETENVFYIWYINGEPMETGASYTVGGELPVGIYRLDVTAFSVDGKRAGSTSHTFHVSPELISDLAWEAEDGEITYPFEIIDGYVSQSVYSDTDITSGGKAIYCFTIESPGEYIVKALVDAVNDGANSLFINIDAEPTDPDMVWDIPLTSGFEVRVARWRGANGTVDYSEYDPKIFTLTAGEHELILRGREANTKIDRLWLEPYNGESAQITLEWDPNSEPDLAGYKLYYGTASGNYTNAIDVGNQVTYTVTGLNPGVTYYFAVTAYNTSGFESDYSNEVVYTVPL